MRDDEPSRILVVPTRAALFIVGSVAGEGVECTIGGVRSVRGMRHAAEWDGGGTVDSDPVGER